MGNRRAGPFMRPIKAVASGNIYGVSTSVCPRALTNPFVFLLLPSLDWKRKTEQKRRGEC